MYRFVELIPDWPEVSQGLSALAFDQYGSDAQTDTHYEPTYRAIWMYPFPDSMRTFWRRDFYEHHKDFVSRLGVDVVEGEGPRVTIGWTVAQAKAWQLLHLFLYDLSVHNQFMRSGEKPRYEHDNGTAEKYAFTTAARMLHTYEKVLGPIV